MHMNWVVRASTLLVCLSASAFADEAPNAARSANEAAAEKVPEVAIESFAHLPVCRRYVPTGSRIAKERCVTPNVAANEREHAVARQQLDALRQQQMIEEQARERARAEALRRRMGY